MVRQYTWEDYYRAEIIDRSVRRLKVLRNWSFRASFSSVFPFTQNLPNNDPGLSGISHADRSLYFSKAVANFISFVRTAHLRAIFTSPRESDLNLPAENGIRIIINDPRGYCSRPKGDGVIFGQDDLPPALSEEYWVRSDNRIFYHNLEQSPRRDRPSIIT